jgi:hypothetical protein
MIADAGFRVMSDRGTVSDGLRDDHHAAASLRRRGAGTSVAPNA